VCQASCCIYTARCLPRTGTPLIRKGTWRSDLNVVRSIYTAHNVANSSQIVVSCSGLSPRGTCSGGSAWCGCSVGQTVDRRCFPPLPGRERGEGEGEGRGDVCVFTIHGLWPREEPGTECRATKGTGATGLRPFVARGVGGERNALSVAPRWGLLLVGRGPGVSVRSADLHPRLVTGPASRAGQWRTGRMRVPRKRGMR